MANKILITPGGTGQVPAGQVLVGKDYTGDLTTFNGKIFVFTDPYNPLDLPPNTIRVKFRSGITPTPRHIPWDSLTQVDRTNNIWDIYKESNNWNGLFVDNNGVEEVLGANTTNVTNMQGLFFDCQYLTSVALFDTSNVTDMRQMFNFDSSLISLPLFNTSKVTNMFYMLADCESLTSIPLFDLSSVTNMERMCEDCINVEQGALALYQRAKNKTTIQNHNQTFTNCGSNTQTGAAELAQIPSDWGGTMP